MIAFSLKQRMGDFLVVKKKKKYSFIVDAIHLEKADITYEEPLYSIQHIKIDLLVQSRARGV